MNGIVSGHDVGDQFTAKLYSKNDPSLYTQNHNWLKTVKLVGWLVGWLVGFYGISTFVGYLTPNPFLCK